MKDPYKDYLQTEYWKTVAKAVKGRAGYRCQVCNSQHDLQAHHRSYDHRGQELDHLDDLICLCRRCHGIFHGTLRACDKEEEKAAVRTVEITEENHKRLRCAREMWHWMRDRGFKPNKAGWAKRMIGQTVPRHFLRML